MLTMIMCYQSHGADGFVLEEKRIRTKSGEPTSGERGSLRRSQRVIKELRRKPEVSFYPSHSFSSGRLLLSPQSPVLISPFL